MKKQKRSAFYLAMIALLCLTVFFTSCVLEQIESPSFKTEEENESRYHKNKDPQASNTTNTNNTNKPAKPTKEPNTTEPGMTEPGTTEHWMTAPWITTDPWTTEPGVIEPGETTEHFMTEPWMTPATQMSESWMTDPWVPEPVVSTDSWHSMPPEISVIPPFGDDDFFASLPSDFTGNNLIKIEGSSCQNGMTVVTSRENQFFLYNPTNSEGPAAHGVTALEVKSGSGVYHYYIDLKSANQYNPLAEEITVENAYIRWCFEVPEAGVYKFASYNRIKTYFREGLFQIDNGPIYDISYVLSDEKINEIKDDTEGGYLNWEGIEVALTPGKHTLTYRLTEMQAPSWQIRDIYLVKKAENAEPEKPIAPPSIPGYTPPANASVYDPELGPDTSWYTGDKTEYVLTTANQFVGFQSLRSDTITYEGITIKLACDMILNEGTVEEILARAAQDSASVTIWKQLNSNWLFKGTFDGQGHTVSGLYMQLTQTGMRGMFGGVGGNAVIKNFTLTNSYYGAPTTGTNKYALGGIVARIHSDANVTISNVTVSAYIQEAGQKFQRIGGFVADITADNVTLTMENCTFNGIASISGNYAGGMIGHVSSASATITLRNCINRGNIVAEAFAGGMIGMVEDSNKITLTNCSNEGTIAATIKNAGGIVGCLNAQTISYSNCTNKGTVRAEYAMGDLFGSKSVTDGETEVPAMPETP